MQLHRIVRFHKVLADVTRIRILLVLTDGPLHGLDIAEKIGITPATVSHHMKKLREAHLVWERRDKNTIFFELDRQTLKHDSFAILESLGERNVVSVDVKERVGTMEGVNINSAIASNFFRTDGTLKNLPSQMKKKLLVLEKLIEGIERGKEYTEKEINAYILKYHEDYATIRREWINNRMMHRENQIYSLNPKEMWVTID